MSWDKARLILDSSTFRHAATVAFLFLLVALVSIRGTGVVLEDLTRSHVRQMILLEARSIYRHAAVPDSRTVALLVQGRESKATGRDRLAVVLAPDGALLYGPPDVAARLSKGDSGSDAVWRSFSLRPRDGHARTVFGAVLSTADGGLYFNAYNLSPMLERMLVIPLLAGTSLLAVLIGSLAISLRHSLRTLGKIDAIRAQMRTFAGGVRRPAATPFVTGDEIDLLHADVQANLKRIEHLMVEVRGVIDYIAHQMRTPLTRLKNTIVSALDKVDGPAHDDLQDAVEETERIHDLFRTVMGLSEIESGRCTHTLAPVDGRRLLEDLRDYYLPLAEERNVSLRLSVDADSTVTADATLLFQALANMLDNALKYGPLNEPVDLYLRASGATREIGVSDHGPGIPQHLRDQATVRFQRLEANSAIAGYGLGLTFVRAIAELHGCDLIMADNMPGLRIGLRFHGPIP